MLYRAATLAALRTGLAPSDAEGIAALARTLRIETSAPSMPGGGAPSVRMNGEDVTQAIRRPEVDASVSAVSAHPAVRQALLPIQRRIAAQGPVVMVGRDITTVVVPDAGVKVYLDATAQERARRRARELQARGVPVLEQSVLDDIERRDLADSTRSTAPLKAGEGVTVVQTDGRTVEAIVEEIAAIAGQAWASDVRGAALGETAS